MTERAQFEHLVAVRGIAALVVLLAHVVQVFWLRIFGLGSWPHNLSSAASYYAVVVFFVLSGFLIAHSIHANIRRHGRLDLIEFFAARLARLYPPLLFAVAVSLLIYLLLGRLGWTGANSLPGDVFVARDAIRVSIKDVAQSLMMKTGMLDINGPLWSLYIEAKLYAIFAGAVYLLHSSRSIPVAIMVAGIAYAGVRFNPEFVRYSAIWLVGCCAYYFWAGRDGVRGGRAVAFFPALVLCIVVADLGARFVPSLEGWTDGRAIAIDVSLAGVIAWLLFRAKIGRFFAPPRLDCSYSLYVTHYPIMLLFNALLVSVAGPDNVLAMVTMFSALAALAALAIARLGGTVEAAKRPIQNQLMALWSRCTGAFGRGS